MDWSWDTPEKGTGMSENKDPEKPPQRGKGDENNGSVGLGSAGIIFGLLFPPVGIFYAQRCWRASKDSKHLAYAAFGFVAAGLLVHSMLFAWYTRNLPLIVHGM
jgi:hypothetical protein